MKRVNLEDMASNAYFQKRIKNDGIIDALIEAGLKEGDMIIAVNGKDMKTTDMLSEMIEDMSAGDKLTLTIVRVNTDDWSQTERDITVTLVEDTGVSNTQDTQQENTPSQGGNPYGDQYQDWYDFYREFFGY